MNTEIEQEVIQRLTVLRSQPARNAEQTAKGRATFLEQAQSLANQPRLPVSPVKKGRHKEWMHAIWTYFITHSTKEPTSMTTLTTLLVIFTLMFGGAGVTVAAAQNSLPDQALYPVKTWSEDVRVNFTADEQARLALALELSERRAAEMQAMLAAGQTLSDELATHYQAQVQSALMLAANQPESQSAAALARVQAALQAQQQAFAGLATLQGAQDQATLQRTRDMLRDMLNLCDTGLQDPDLLRQQLRDQDHQQFHTTPAGQQQHTGTAQPGSGANNTGGANNGGAGSAGGNTGGSGNTNAGTGSNPWTTGTPTPGSGYGSGNDGSTGSGNTGDGTGSNPWTTGTPTPGSGSGSGEGGNGGSGSGSGSGQPNASCTPLSGSGSGGGNGGGPGGKP